MICLEAKMKIVNIESVLIYHVETDADQYPYYRRYAGGGWEQQMGESWESVYDDKELEALFQRYFARG